MKNNLILSKYQGENAKKAKEVVLDYRDDMIKNYVLRDNYESYIMRKSDNGADSDYKINKFLTIERFLCVVIWLCSFIIAGENKLSDLNAVIAFTLFQISSVITFLLSFCRTRIPMVSGLLDEKNPVWKGKNSHFGCWEDFSGDPLGTYYKTSDPYYGWFWPHKKKNFFTECSSQMLELAKDISYLQCIHESFQKLKEKCPVDLKKVTYEVYPVQNGEDYEFAIAAVWEEVGEMITPEEKRVEVRISRENILTNPGKYLYEVYEKTGYLDLSVFDYGISDGCERLTTRADSVDFQIDYDKRGLQNAIFKITDLLKVKGLKTQRKYKNQVEKAISKKEAEIEDITRSLRKAEKELKNLKRKEKDIEGESSVKDAENSPADIFPEPKAFENHAMDTAICKTTV